MVSSSDPCPCGSGQTYTDCCKFDRPRNPKRVPGQNTKELRWSEDHRLAYCVLLLQGGHPIRVWAAYLPSIQMIKEYVPTEKGGYECFVYDADFLRRRLANVASFPGFVGVFQDPNWHTGEWFEGARVVGDDLNAFLDMVRDSGVLLSDARAAGPEDEALSSNRSYLASSLREAHDMPEQDLGYEGFDLTPENTSPPDRLLEALVNDLDSYEIVFRTAHVKWRFPTSACSVNTQIVTRRAAELGIHIEPWAGWLIRDGGASAHSRAVMQSEMGTSVCDLTLTQPAIFQNLQLKVRGSAFDPDGSAFDLDAELHRIRQSSPLLQTRIVGKVPDRFIYRGKPVV